MDRACDLCGYQPATYPMGVVIGDLILCYECWEIEAEDDRDDEDDEP